jgi:hypothetical protein
MSRARRYRRTLKWTRYIDRYITPARGGMLDNAMPIGYAKALLRSGNEPWTASNAYWYRQARRSRR